MEIKIKATISFGAYKSLDFFINDRIKKLEDVLAIPEKPEYISRKTVAERLVYAKELKTKLLGIKSG